ncbi:Lactation elevated protein 1 [Hordeum vulgare]|nr:Lactation elevated protein 1 [Hordeum vulgare]
MYSRWAACLEQVRNAPPSGTVESDYDKIAQHRYKDMEASKGKFFKLEHCWKLLQKCEKWKLIDKEYPPKRGSLTNMDEDVPRNLNKPDGDKKTKEKMKREQEASSLREKIDAIVQSNELMLLKSLEIKKELSEKKAKEKQEKWQFLKEEGLRKAAIKERRAHAAENKSMSLLLAEENKIMSMNHDDMDDLIKTWHDMARREILKKRMVVSAGSCYNSGDVFSAPYGGNVDDFGAGVGTTVGDGFGGADELQDGLDGAE